jgi:hypothetical protein
MNRNNRMAATLFPRDIVSLRNISINTLHKEDDDDDNNHKINNNDNDNNNYTPAKCKIENYRKYPCW